jgi:hypothetical protein
MGGSETCPYKRMADDNYASAIEMIGEKCQFCYEIGAAANKWGRWHRASAVGQSQALTALQRDQTCLRLQSRLLLRRKVNDEAGVSYPERNSR